MIQQIRALVSMMRPLNGLLGWGAFLLGMAMGDIHFSPLVLGLSLGVILLAYGFGNVDNDVVDLPVDRQVHPHRPLPRGDVDSGTARLFSLFLGGGAFLLALPLGRGPALFVGGMLVWTWGYNRAGKRLPFAGNLMVAIAASGVFPFLLLVSGRWEVHVAWATAFSVLFHLVREIVKDCADVEGDRRVGYRTLPLVWGLPASLSGARLIQAGLLTLVILGGASGPFQGTGYAVFTGGIYGVGGLVLLFLTRPASESCARAARVLKGLLIPAFLGLFLGS